MRLVFSPILLSCSSCFLCTLQQNRAHIEKKLLHAKFACTTLFTRCKEENTLARSSLVRFFFTNRGYKSSTRTNHLVIYKWLSPTDASKFSFHFRAIIRTAFKYSERTLCFFIYFFFFVFCFLSFQ